MTALGIVVFVVGLLASVMLHEAGHFVMARRFGMKATEFFVGFGPTLFSRRRGETEYGVKAVPAGGFVKIVGMTPLEEVAPGDEERAFFRQPWKQKTAVLVAGSTVHFVLCIVLVVLTVAFIGQTTEQHASLGTVYPCVAADPTVTTCQPGTVAGPAYAAGLRTGDVVTAVDGKPVKDSAAFIAALQEVTGPSTVAVLRGGASTTVTLTPATLDRPVLDAEGKATTKTAQRKVIGVAVQANYKDVRYGVGGTLTHSASQIGTFVTGTYDTVAHKLGTITKLYSKDRDPEGLVGVVGASRVTGDIFSADIPAKDKVANAALLLASLNLFVGAFNLLPLMPLDGGHVAVVWFEQLRDRLRRLRGYRGELQRVDLNKLLPVTAAVVVLFIGVTVLLLGADIVNPIRIGQ